MMIFLVVSRVDYTRREVDSKRYGHLLAVHTSLVEPFPHQITATLTRYLRQPFANEPDFTVTSVNFDINKLLAMALEPA